MITEPSIGLVVKNKTKQQRMLEFFGIQTRVCIKEYQIKTLKTLQDAISECIVSIAYIVYT